MDKSKDFDKSRKIEVIPMENNYERFVIVDRETKELLDDAQGYGYTSVQKAHACWSYKTRDRSKDDEKKSKTSEIKKWMKEHKSFIHLMEEIEFEICKGSWGPDDKFDTALVKQMLKENNLDISFKPSELLKVYRKGKL